MTFDKIRQNLCAYASYMVQKEMETLTVATMKLLHTRASVEFCMDAKWQSFILVSDILIRSVHVVTWQYGE